MAWTAPPTVVAQTAVSASLWNTSVRDNLNACAVALGTTSGRIFCASAATVLAERVPDSNLVATGQTTASLTYVDLATTGPALTHTTSGRMFASWGAIMSNSTAGSGARMGMALSGATISAAADTNSACIESANANDAFQVMWTTIFDGLAAGSETITSKYRAVGAGTASFTTRGVSMIPF